MLYIVYFYNIERVHNPATLDDHVKPIIRDIIKIYEYQYPESVLVICIFYLFISIKILDGLLDISFLK